jgi:cytochrome c-type biogenesis protein CcmE
MENALKPKRASGGRTKFFVGGFLIFAAVVYLIISSTKASAQYFLTVEELNARGSNGRDVRVSGAIIGDSIQYDLQTQTLRFLVANVPGDNKEIEKQGGLAAVLHTAVLDVNRPRMQVVYIGPKPDLMRNEAQAIMTGQMDNKGIFHANELLLKCPTKYAEAVPGQAGSSTSQPVSGSAKP